MLRKRRKLKKATETVRQRIVEHDRMATDIPAGARIVPDLVYDPLAIRDFATWDDSKKQWVSDGVERVWVAKNLRDDCLLELMFRGCLDRHDANRNKILGAAGIKYREYWNLTRLDVLVAFDPERPGGGAAGPSTPITDTIMIHRDRYYDALAALEELDSIVNAIVLSNMQPALVGSLLTGLAMGPETRAVAIDRLSLGLARLVRHFGMETDKEQASRAA